MRQYTGIDKFIHSFDQALRSLVPGTTTAHRENPSSDVETKLAVSEARHVAGLMRVNHSGEVCAQALYHGQALTAKLPNVRHEMEQAAVEEQDHLAWFEDRLKELDSHTSLLNPVWYGLSFGLCEERASHGPALHTSGRSSTDDAWSGLRGAPWVATRHQAQAGVASLIVLGAVAARLPA